MINNICRPGHDLELKIHDGIIGAIILLSVVAGVMVSPVWFWLAGVIGVLISIALLIYLAFRGWSIIPASLLCSLVVILTNHTLDEGALEAAVRGESHPEALVPAVEAPDTGP